MSSDVKAEESDFIQEFMNLDEFFAAATTAAVTSSELIQPPYDTDISTSGQTPGGHTGLETADSTNEHHCSQGGNVVENGVIGVQEVPLVDDQIKNVRQRNVSSSSDETVCADTRSSADVSDSNSSRTSTGNGMNRDKKYWDRRLKNNIAAKRSRDAKRLKETEVVKRWTLLEEENKRLKEEIANMQKRLETVSGEKSNLAI